MKAPEIIIIGGGLTGLLAANLLQNHGFSCTVIEARNRLGGRIYTLRPDGGADIEMGATWLGSQHRYLIELLDELEISSVEQFMGPTGYYEPMSVSPPQLVDLPPNQDPSYRIDGGTDTIITALANQLEQASIHEDEVVKSIEQTSDCLTIRTEKHQFTADYVISTLPPKLLAETVLFSPALPDELIEIASKTHTWMAESIKVAFAFEEPFWRDPSSSGTIFSNVGPVNEMYDHSSGSSFALKGFMNGVYHAESQEKRKELIIGQLRRFYGDRADSYLSYHDLVWRNDPFTFSDYQQTVVPHLNNGHEVYQTSYLNGRLLLAGAETATQHPGYMDGAVESAFRAVQHLRHNLNKIDDLSSS